MTEELLLILAKSLSEEDLIERLEENLYKYKLAPNEENLLDLGFSCVLLSTKIAYQGKSIEDSVNELQKFIEYNEFGKKTFENNN